MSLALPLGLQHPPVAEVAVAALERWEVQQPEALQVGGAAGLQPGVGFKGVLVMLAAWRMLRRCLAGLGGRSWSIHARLGDGRGSMPPCWRPQAVQGLQCSVHWIVEPKPLAYVHASTCSEVKSHLGCTRAPNHPRHAHARTYNPQAALPSVVPLLEPYLTEQPALSETAAPAAAGEASVAARAAAAAVGAAGAGGAVSRKRRASEALGPAAGQASIQPKVRGAYPRRPWQWPRLPPWR